MTVETCLNSAYTAGDITRDERDAMRTLYDNLMHHYGNADQARAEMVARLMNQHQHAQRQALIAEDVRQRIEAYMLNFRNARGEPDPAQALVYLIEHNGQIRMPDGMSSVQGRFKAIAGLAQAQMEAAIDEFRRTWVTGQTRSTARLENVLREARGEATGDAAAQVLAQAWNRTSEWLRMQFNEAGGAIPRLEDWGLPQVHDRAALLARSMEDWIADITPRLDPARMRHPLTGNPMTPGDLRASLEYIYRNVTTDGWRDREATAARHGLGALSNQRAEQRFLVFRTADDWMAYNRDYGGGADIFAAMMNHVKGMAEDVAAMQVLGPNPQATMIYLSNFVTRQAALHRAGEPAVFATRRAMTGTEFTSGQNGATGWIWSADPEDYARASIRRATDMWDLYRGAAGAVVSQRVADVAGALRNWNVATKLGSASVSAITDNGFQLMARHFAGLSTITQLPEVVGAFAAGTKRDAVAAGLILDTALHMVDRDARWAGGLDGRGMTALMADRVIAASGLAAMTQAGKHAFGLAWMAEYGLRAGDAFDRLPEKLQRNLQRYGITPADWDAMRAVPLHHDSFLRPIDILAAHENTPLAASRIAERYLEMILQDTEYATPEGTLAAKAAAYGGLGRGTIPDEARRSIGQFKMFSISVAMLQAERIMSMGLQDGAWRGAGYAAGLIISTTMLGALAMQIKEIVAGKKPKPMDGEHAVKFWGAAMAQGGGFGIFGDFLASEQSRTGGGFARAAVGPTGDLVASVLALGPGNMGQWMRGEKTTAGREAVRFLGSNTPGGTLWYARAAYEHAILERLQRLVDPDASKAFANRIAKQRRDWGNEFWWRPGEAMPGR